MIISVVSAKGGTGKSTVCLNLAAALASLGRRVLVMDADPQGTIARWAEDRRQDYPDILPDAPPPGDKKMRKLEKRYDLVLFDSPPTFKKSMKEVLRVADLAVIPLTPGMADLWSARRLVEVYLDEKRERPALDARLLISRVDRRTRAGREFRSRAEELNIPVFLTEITQRAAYNDAWATGVTIDRLTGAREAAREFQRLAREVLLWTGRSMLARE